MRGIGIVGHRFGDVFVENVGRGKKTGQAYRSGPEAKWEIFTPTYLVICDQGHESELNQVELFNNNKEKCKLCQISKA